jgi:GTP-binding protein
LTDTKGKGILNTLFHGYLPFLGGLRANEHGSLVAHETGTSNLYGLLGAQGRGTLFLGPAVLVYEGMVVGRANRNEDLVVNVCKAKQLSNMRSRGSGVSDHFDMPATLSLEEAVEYLGNDELLEVTPKSLRLRKTILNANDRKKGKSV